jgi:tetratricopeptide (TPR) repeat protein
VKKLYGVVSLLVLASAAPAQESQISNVTGRLRSGERILRGYLVQLDSRGPRGDAPPQADVQLGGEFAVRNVPYGDYMLRVTNYHGDTIVQQFISIHDRISPIDVLLPESAPSPTGGTVSFAQLRHPPAKKAVEAAAAAQRFAASGHVDRAVEQLRRALEISPEYSAAHSNLAVEYMRMQRFDEARAEIERALEIAGPNAHDYANLAFAYAGLQRLPEAMQTARRALALDRTSAPAHYLLGSLMALTPATRGEGLAHLEVAAETMASARKELEKWKR